MLIAGRTGVGKSTLINSVFQGKLATTGQGRPVTTNIREITKKGIPLSIIDTRGLELADFRETLAKLKEVLRERNSSSDPQKHIHIGWVCLSEDSRRVESAESDLCKLLADYCPTVVVITKARSDNGFRSEVQSLMPDAKNVLRVRAIPEAFDDGYELPPMGLVELVEITDELVPEGHRNALAASQRVSVRTKKNRAHAIVATSAAAAATAGVSPIPFSDCVILVPIQVGMLAGVSATFGLELSSAFLSTIVASAAGCTAATFAGRALVANLLKFVPGAGTAAGGVISASTAAAMTTFMGEAYIATLAYFFEKDVDATPTPDEVAKHFKQQLMRKKSA